MRIGTRKQIHRGDSPVRVLDRPPPPALASGGRWSYEGATGPEYWADLDPCFSTCRDGCAQSPIALQTSTERSPGSFTVDYRAIAPIRIATDGAMIVVPGVPSCAIELDGERFELQQMHIHHPAEHRIDGRLLDMELHFVHQSSSGSMAVLAVLARVGLEHEVLAPIVANLPAETVMEVTIGGTFYPEDLLPLERGYFRYAGSRTMPPCDEGVTWLVLEQPIEVSAKQIAAITALFPFNARPIQPLNGREVHRFDPASMRRDAV
jgi:carbonic anhydrase